MIYLSRKSSPENWRIILLRKRMYIYIDDYIKLQVSGRVTYNGHGMDEFTPQRTSAYISQYDLHIGELTVRETLAFSARCQGVGASYGQ